MDGTAAHKFRRNERLKLRRDFRRCFKCGSRAGGEYVVVYAAKNGLGLTRLGAGSTRRLGCAVERNRAKRLVREAFRLTKRELPESTDLVVMPKIPWREPTLEELKVDLVTAAHRAAAKLEPKA